MTQDDIQSALTNSTHLSKGEEAHLVIVLYVGLGNEDPLIVHRVAYLVTGNYECVNPLYRSAVKC